jgi:hypothetical protein
MAPGGVLLLEDFDTGRSAPSTVQVPTMTGLIDLGLAPGDIDRFLEALADPDTIVGSSVLISTWGRRAAHNVQSVQVSQVGQS